MELPVDLLSLKARTPQSTIFGFGEHSTIASYVPKKNRNILSLSIISSHSYDNSIDQTSGQATKPDMITYYNKTKSGVDVVDKLCASYNVARNTRSCPMVVFVSMLNVAGINAQVICRREKYTQGPRRRHFSSETRP
ncbi:uncharacterized protein [Diabrotica undecimpunctata]|uniref:uncharacterized protein n=1 Tax=Diabrotica undecimpunctata TaxID=50387 RepID=UPI003B63D29B